MHVFCDASETGYGASIYVVAADEKGGRRATLLSAKAKVAPLKAQSIPRLELCAPLLEQYQKVLANLVYTGAVLRLDGLNNSVKLAGQLLVNVCSQPSCKNARN